MTSIHDDGLGSSSDEVSWRFKRLHQEHDALTVRQDELESVLAVSRTGYCRLDRDLAVLAASSQLKAELGHLPDVHIDWGGILSRVAREDRCRLEGAVRAAFSAGSDVELVVHIEPAGRPRQCVALRGRTTSTGESGGPELILTTRNVSSEQDELVAQLEHERRAREVAEQINRAKDQFLSRVSHELRSPLMAMLGWNRILELKCRDDPEVSAIVPRIEQSARAQLKIVNDLVDLVRINTGQLRIDPRPLQLGKVVRLAVDQAQPTALAKGIEIVARLDAAAGHLRGDPDRLQQVVTHLLSNAIKFTPSSGTITVSLREVGPHIELSVHDTGKGIEPAALSHLFDPPHQGGRGSTRHWGGLGLGLTLVREIVALHAGEVSAHSEGPGTGATFVVRLPAMQSGSEVRGEEGRGEDKDRQEEPIAARPPLKQALAGISILVVDDVLDARTVVAETLRLEGAEVTVADCARVAYEELQRRRFDILVTDIGMPDEDGYSLVRKLRKLRTGTRTLAIAVTAYVSKEAVAQAMEAGFDIHVPKPINFDRFMSLMRSLARP